MIIDFHVHTFPDPIAPAALKKLTGLSRVRPSTDATARGTVVSMDASGVDLSVVLPVATSPRQVADINAAAIQVNRTFEGRLLSFGSIHPDCDDWRQILDGIAAAGLKGIKLHPVFQGVDLDDPRYLRILEYAGVLGLVVVTHSGTDIGYPEQVRCSPRMARNALRQVGPVKLVLAHMGGWRCWDEAAELLADTSALLDTSFSIGELVPLDAQHTPDGPLSLLNEAQFLDMVRLFGADRILFGSDSPWSSQKDSLAWLRALPLSAEKKTAILGGNAQTLLGLDGSAQ